MRAARDNAIALVQEQRQRAETAEAAVSQMRGMNETQGYNIARLQEQLESTKRERDDAMMMALEYETKLKAAEAKLAKIEEAMHGVKAQEAEVEKPKPHYVDQPRDEVGKFQPIEEAKTYDSGSQGSF